MPRGIVVRYVYQADPIRSVASALVSLAMVISGLLFALVLKFLTDAAFHRDKGAILVAAALLAAQSATVVVGGWAGTTLGVALRERATLHFDSRMAELASGIHHIAHHERPDYLDEMFILQHNHQQLAAVQDALVNNLSTLVRLVLTVAVLASLQPLLLLLPLAGIPSVLASLHVAHLRHRVEDKVAPQRRLVLRLFEIGSDRDAAKEIRVYDLGPDLLARSDEARAIAHGLEDHAELRAGLLGGLGWLFFGLGFVAAMVLVARQAATGHASPGDVVLALTLAGTVNSSVTGLANAVGWLVDNLKSGQRLAWLEELATDAAAQATPAHPTPVPSILHGGIRFEGVTFRYPGTAVDVLADVDLHIPSGSTVAIVGDNGAGKTTLVKLLCRFYDPSGGRVTIDGTDLRQFDVEAWRARLSGSFQDFARPELVARETVGIGRLSSLDDEAAVRDRAAASPRHRRLCHAATRAVHPPRPQLRRRCRTFDRPVAEARARSGDDARRAAPPRSRRTDRESRRRDRARLVRALRQRRGPNLRPVGRDHGPCLPPLLHGANGGPHRRGGRGSDKRDRLPRRTGVGRPRVRRAV